MQPFRRNRYGPKIGGLCPFGGGRTGSPSNTKSPGPRPSSIPSGSLMYAAVWPQYVYCGQTAGWMKTPLGSEVDIGPGRTVLDRVPAPAKGAQPSLLFSAHVYCGHGRPSQLLLSSCISFQTWFCVKIKHENSSMKFYFNMEPRL